VRLPEGWEWVCLLRSMLRNTKNMEKYIRKVTRVGKRSLSIVIPAEIADELKLKEKQKLVITTKGRSIVIKDWK